MNVPLRSFILLLALLSTLSSTVVAAPTASPAPAPVENDAPAQAAHTFFDSLATSKDVAAWQLLSEASKGAVIKEVAAEGKVDEDKVRAYFDKGEASVLKAFWDVWRTRLRAQDVARLATFKTSVQDATSATVMLHLDGEKNDGFMKMLKEGNDWKFGMIETIFPNGFNAASANPSTPSPPGSVPSPPPHVVQTFKPDEPAAAVKGFFTALAGKDYRAVWGLFSDRTQNEFVKVAAAHNKKTEVETRKAFVDLDPEVLQTFYDPFRQDSFADLIAEQANLTSGTVKGEKSSVTIAMPNGKSIDLLMFKEHGSWKIGWAETFFPNGLNGTK